MMLLFPKEHDTWFTYGRLWPACCVKTCNPEGVIRSDRGCHRALVWVSWSLYCLTSGWRRLFYIMLLQAFNYLHLSLKSFLLLTLRTYSCFYASFFFSCFQLVDGLWGSLLEHLLTSLLSASKFSPTCMVPTITYLKGAPLNSVYSTGFFCELHFPVFRCLVHATTQMSSHYLYSSCLKLDTSYSMSTRPQILTQISSFC